ncbi:MAG: Sec-independent protein translocase protein TatB [Acidimicrobiales bacterium]|jgi:sec-independent protein translocase protein TatB|nr:Sec-independent protein translocase protein TatB [Acidimicrobiales bacterium]
MFSNIGGLEVLFVMMVALIVLGPTKLPEAARQIGKFVNQVRQISSGFQKEFREAIQDPVMEADKKTRGAIQSTKIAVTEPFSSAKAVLNEATSIPTSSPTTPTSDKNGATAETPADAETAESAPEPTPEPAASATDTDGDD